MIFGDIYLSVSPDQHQSSITTHTHTQRGDSPSNNELHHDSVWNHDSQNFLQHTLLDAEREEEELNESGLVNTACVSECPSHARWCQIGVFVLQFAVQSDAAPLPVVGQQRQQLVVFLQGRSRRHRVPETWGHRCTLNSRRTQNTASKSKSYTNTSSDE